MRHATRFLFTSALVFAATRAGAQVPDSAPMLSDQLLRMWNRDDTIVSDPKLDETYGNQSGFELDDSGASPLGSGYQRPAGGTHTPNLDRLLGNGMDAAPDPSAPVAKDSPYGFAPNGGLSKGGSPGSSIDTGRSRCGERGHRQCRNCRPHNPPPPPECNPPTPTPEPASMLLLGLGAGAAAGARAIRKRRKK